MPNEAQDISLEFARSAVMGDALSEHQELAATFIRFQTTPNSIAAHAAHTGYQ